MPPTSPTGSGGREGGFALYELILALAILGLVAGVVLPRVARAPGPAELRTKVQDIAALLRSDRNAALRSGQDVLSSVDLEGRLVVSGIGGRSVDLPGDIAVQFVQSSREETEDGGGIRFSADGRSSGGVLQLSRGGSAYEISVNWLTAGVLISDHARDARATP